MNESFYLECIQKQIDKDRKRFARHGYTFVEHDATRQTIGELIGAIFAIDNDSDARRFFDDYVAWMTALPAEDRSPTGTADEVAKSNIGWAFGEGMAAERIAMWRNICGAAHPVFGAWLPTPTEAVRAGLDAGGR